MNRGLCETALDEIRQKQLRGELEVVRAKNRFADRDSELGYRDILLNIRFLDPATGEARFDGHIAELQLHHEKFQEVRSKGGGHANYGATRFLIDFLKIRKEEDDLVRAASPEAVEQATDEHEDERPQTQIFNQLKNLWNFKLR